MEEVTETTATLSELQAMGKVVVEIEVVNSEDVGLQRRSLLTSGEVRRAKLMALVDTGATMISIPEDAIERLGLPVVRQATSKYADGRTERRNIYGPATLNLLGRTCTVDVLSSHTGQPALLGQLPLEGLDLLVDPRRQRLIPNPESPDMPMVDMISIIVTG